jgi:calcineurin-like phosphoesterase family protein
VRTWFTSDTHFGHARAIEHGRPFASVQEMEEVMVANWNRVVGDNDRVYHLGDFAMGQRELNVPNFSNRLKGERILLWGNHDYIGDLHKHKSYDKKVFWSGLYKRCFHKVTGPFDLEVAGVLCHLSHLPFVGDHEGTVPRFMDQRPIPNGKPLIHGHVHDTWLVRKDAGYPDQINVGVDMWNFTPVSEEELEPWLR